SRLPSEDGRRHRLAWQCRRRQKRRWAQFASPQLAAVPLTPCTYCALLKVKGGISCLEPSWQESSSFASREFPASLRYEGDTRSNRHLLYSESRKTPSLS